MIRDLYPIIGVEQVDGTFSDGSLGDRIRELILSMEATALAHGFTRIRKPRVVIHVGEDCAGRGTHLHAGFIAAPLDLEPSA